MAEIDMPRLRVRQRISSKKTSTYYFWDGRGRGVGEIPLGKDRALALHRWQECENGLLPSGKQVRGRENGLLPGAKQVRGRAKKLPLRQAGKRRKLDPADWAGRPAWQRLMFLNAERRAIQARRSFTLTPRDFFVAVDKAQGLCEVSGMAFENTGSRSPFAPSLDRIDSTKGYEPGNVRVICHIANVAMNVWGIDALVRLAEAILRNKR